jgi:hypothetical protein
MKWLYFPGKTCLCVMLVLALASSLLSTTRLAFAQTCPETAAGIQSAADCGFCKTDLNQDGKLTIVDASILRKCIGSHCTKPDYDVNGNGSIDENDYQLLMSCMKMGCSK